MKWFMLTLFLCLCVSCSTMPENDPVVILSFEKIVDASSPESSMCEDFELTNFEITNYFSIAESMSPTESNQRSLILPCKYAGELKLSGKPYKYEIYAGGSGFLFDREGWLYRGYICEGNKCCSKFKSLC